MQTIQIALAAGVSALALASTANAVTTISLHEGTGWHYGENHTSNNTSMYNYDGTGSTTQFTLKAVVTDPVADLSFVDGFIAGDVYSISIQGLGSKTQFLDSTNYDSIPDLTGGPFGTTFAPDWLSGSYAHFQAQLTTGTYTITVKDLCGTRGNPSCPGFPAGWGIRLDAVPEASTWVLMLAGVFGMGAALRRRQAIAAA